MKLDDTEQLTPLLTVIQTSTDPKAIDAAFTPIAREFQKYIAALIKRRKWYAPGFDYADLIQESLIEVLKAAKSYDPDKGATFKTYATLCVLAHLKSIIDFANKPIRNGNPISLDRKIGDGPDSRTIGEELTDNRPCPLEALEQQDEAQTLFNQLRTELSEWEKTVYDVYFIANSYRDIAKRLNLRFTRKNEKAIDNAVQRIRRKAAEYGKRLKAEER